MWPKCVLYSISLVFSFLLASCAATQEYQKPAVDVPAAWGRDGPMAGEGTFNPTHWRNYFRDPRLLKLIEAGLEHNSDVKIAAARVLEAQAQWGTIRAERLPLVTASGSSTFARIPSGLQTAGNSENNQRFDAGVSLASFEIDLWGRMASMSEAAKSGFLATQASQQTVQMSVVADIATAYYAVLQFDELIQLTQQSMQTRSTALELTKNANVAGGVAALEVQQAKALAAQSSALVDSLRYQRKAATNRLNFLVGTVPSDLPAGYSIDKQARVTILDTAIPSDVLLTRPDVVAAEQRLRAANANVNAARAAFFPRLLLSTGLGFASQGLAGLLQAGAWNFQPLISAPIFDGGRLRSGSDIAQARNDLAVAEYEKVLKTAFREVADLLAARESAESQIASVQASLDAADGRLTVVKARVAVGLASSMDLLDAQREALFVQQSMVQAQRARLDVATQLFKSLGGGQLGEAPAKNDAAKAML